MKLFGRILCVILVIVCSILLLVLNSKANDLALVNIAAYYYIVNKAIEVFIHDDK